jgi:hypothetical protein
MTEAQHKPGDIVNGHVLALQPDGSKVWLPVGAAEQHKPGDIANGHRLTQQPDGSLAWVPIEAKQTKERKAWPWVVGGLAVLVLLALIIPSAVTAGQRADNAANDKPTVVAGQVTDEPEPEPEPEMVTIPSIIVGMTADSATAALKGIGLVVNYSGPGDATVTAIDPGQGASVEEGSVITFTVQEKPKLTLAQENALQQAQQYLSLMPFSRQGLIDQMSSQYGSGYPVDVATWAVDYLNPDWNAEAAEAAKSYLDVMAFSRDGLYEQLTSEHGAQFTPEQANAGLTAVGY